LQGSPRALDFPDFFLPFNHPVTKSPSHQIPTFAAMPISLVTGGAGFIGSHVVNELLRAGHMVVVLDDLSGGFAENVNEKAVFVKGSVTDHELLAELFAKHQFDYVYHLAAYAAEGLSHFIKRFNYSNNLIGSVNLINEAVKHKVKCFVFTSSIAVYGALKPPMKEEMIPMPEDPYGIAKLAVEMDLKATHEMFGMDYVIFRPHNVYGEFQNIGDRYRNVVGIFMNQLMQGKPLSVFGDGSQTRAFSYIGDIAPVIADCVNIPAAKNQVFNIGADKEYSVLELAEETMRAMGIKGEVRHLEARNEVLHAHADHSKVKKIFGEEKITSLEEGLKRMADWAKAAGVRKSQRFEAIEITEKLPPFWLED
jgi:UDP-glucose 4-epimerase